MVRRKKLRNRVLAIMMALCLVCGTVQTSTVVYATGETGNISEQTGDADSASDETDGEESTKLSDADGGEDDGSSDTQSDDSGVAEDDAQEEATDEENTTADDTTAENQESEFDESVVNTESTEESDGSASAEEETSEEEDASSESVTTEKEVIVEETLTATAVYSLLTASLTAESGDRTLTVDAGATEVEGMTYTTIQDAINYIYGLTDDDGSEDGWKILVAAGTYARFVVQPGVDELIITGAGDSTIIQTLCDDGITIGKADSCGIYQSSGVSSDTQGIIVNRAGNFALQNVKITMGTNSTSWKSAAVGLTNGDTTMEADNGFTLVSCTIEGAGASSYSTGGIGVFVDNKVDKLMITNCKFTDCLQAIYYENSASGPEAVEITNNTFTDCSFAFHGSWDSAPVSGNMGVFKITGNTITGSDSLRNKIVIQDTSDVNMVTVTISGNTLTNALIGTVNLQASGECNDVLSDNTFDNNSFYVNAVEPGSINVAYASYQVTSDSTGYWVLTGIDDLAVSWGGNPEGTIAAVQAAVDAANASGSTTLEITGLDSTGDGNVDTLIKTFTWFKDAVYYVSSDTGSLTVEKNIVNGNSSKEFTFKVEIDTSTAEVADLRTFVLNGAYGTKTDADGNTEDVEFTNSVATFTLSDGESVTFENLPVGATYTVTESAASNYTAAIEADDASAAINGAVVMGTVQSEGTTVSYTNTYSSSFTGFDISKSKEATQLDKNYESDVTISLPSASYDGYLDVAFVLDGSTSHDNTNLAEAAAELLDELVGYENLTVKVSITIFGGYNPILETTELLELTESNVEELKNFLTTDYKSLDGRSGSNLQAGVEKARELLNADTDVDGSNKYMIILTDGGARMWYDSESGEAMSDAYAYGNSVWWNSNEDWCNRYGVTGSESYVSEAAPTFESVWTEGENGTDIGKYGLTYSDWRKAVAGNTSISYASWDTAMHGDDYYTTYEAACYYAATSIVEASQEVNVCMVTYQYYSNKTYTTFTEDFKTWLENYVTRYDIGVEENVDAETAAEVFSAVKDQLIQLVDAGSVLVDEIGDSVDADGIAYDFDFINDISRLILTVDGEALSVTQIDDYTYGFGSAAGSSDGTTYPFILTYYPDGTTYSGTVYDECFVLEINVPITKNDQVKLTYGVVLTNPQDGSGTYGAYDQYGDNNDGSESYDLYTNNVARLYPVDSNGNSLPPEDFQKPTVSYTIVNIEVTKVWSDSNNQDEIRPDSVTISLLKNGTETGDTLVLSSSNGWTGSFVRLRLMTGETADIYTISEAAVTGYTTAITGDASAGFTITNSHTVTTTGTEEPEDNTDTTEEEETETETTESTVASEAVIADTGDNAPLGLAIFIAAISEFTLMILIFQQMRKKRKQ